MSAIHVLRFHTKIITNFRATVYRIASVVPRSRFLGDIGVPLLEFQGDIYKILEDTPNLSNLPIKLKRYTEISVYF